MNRKTDKKTDRNCYTITDMAHLLGVTTHMLRHYEKMDIIHPVIDPDNRYRYYSVVDIRRFNLSRSLLTSGVSLEQSSKILNHMDLKELEQLTEEKIKQKEIEIVKAHQAIQNLRQIKKIYGDWIYKVGQVWVEYYPTMWRLNVSMNEKAIISDTLKRQKEEWLSFLPGVKWVSKFRKDVLKTFAEGKIEYEYGLICQEHDALEMGLSRTPDVEVIPGSNYLVNIFTKSDREPLTWEDIKGLTDYLQKNNIKNFGDMFSYMVASEVDNGQDVNYHKLVLKI